MIIMGIDPGLSITGVGIIKYQNKQLTYIDSLAVRTGSIKKLEERLKYIYEELSLLIDKYKPDECSVEEIFYSKNVKTAITMGHTRGIILLAAINKNVKIASYSPREVKMATVGNGAALKNQVQFMVQRILKMKEKPTPLDASDALALAICHAQRL
ncbi:MAG: crossover junction endodeoxyribonuclease RuvC [Calditrichia bacterium]|nr:crossover junction endodeoxyribonuclease RuvC [Calditrichia bacterium]